MRFRCDRAGSPGPMLFDVQEVSVPPGVYHSQYGELHVFY